MIKYKYPHIANRARKSFYKLPCWIGKVGYHYPDGKFSYKIEKCIWNEGKEDEREGYPSCTAQLVCPYVGSWKYDNKGEKVLGIGRCHQECKNPQIRQAIEAWITLHPDIM